MSKMGQDIIKALESLRDDLKNDRPLMTTTYKGGNRKRGLKKRSELKSENDFVKKSIKKKWA